MRKEAEGVKEWRMNSPQKLRMGDSVVMPSFTEEIVWEEEPLGELGG